MKRILNIIEEWVVLSLDGNLLGTQKELIICFLYISPEGFTIYNEETGYNGIEVFKTKLYQIAHKGIVMQIFC